MAPEHTEEMSRIFHERSAQMKRLAWEIAKDIDRAQLSVNEYWIAGKTAIGPVVFSIADGDVVDISPPLREFRIKESIETEKNAFPHLFRAAKRIRNLVSYACRARVPVNCLLIGRNFAVPQRFEPITADSSMFLDAFPFRGGKWKTELETKYDRAQELLEKIPADGFLDRAIAHLSDALWVGEAEDSFLHSWRALEAIGDNDFLDAQMHHEKSLSESIGAYLEPTELDRARIRGSVVPKLRRVLVSVQVRLARDDLQEEIRGLEKLRNAIAHGEVTPDKYRVIVEKKGSLMGLARGVVESAIVEALRDS